MYACKAFEFGIGTQQYQPYLSTSTAKKHRKLYINIMFRVAMCAIVYRIERSKRTNEIRGIKRK